MSDYNDITGYHPSDDEPCTECGGFGPHARTDGYRFDSAGTDIECPDCGATAADGLAEAAYQAERDAEQEARWLAFFAPAFELAAASTAYTPPPFAEIEGCDWPF